jgi:hypothetical protein
MEPKNASKRRSRTDPRPDAEAWRWPRLGTFSDRNGRLALVLTETPEETFVPRYFFNAYSGTSFTQDTDGQDLPDLEAARSEALTVAETFWSDLPSSFAREMLSVEILDEAGQKLTTVHVLDTGSPRTPGRVADALSLAS